MNEQFTANQDNPSVIDRITHLPFTVVDNEATRGLEAEGLQPAKIITLDISQILDTKQQEILYSWEFLTKNVLGMNQDGAESLKSVFANYGIKRAHITIQYCPQDIIGKDSFSDEDYRKGFAVLHQGAITWQQHFNEVGASGEDFSALVFTNSALLNLPTSINRRDTKNKKLHRELVSRPIDLAYERPISMAASEAHNINNITNRRIYGTIVELDDQGCFYRAPGPVTTLKNLAIVNLARLFGVDTNTFYLQSTWPNRMPGHYEKYLQKLGLKDLSNQ